MVLRIKNYARDLFDCSFSDVLLLEDSNHLIRYNFKNLEFIEEKLESPI